MAETVLSIRGLHVRLSRDGRASTVLDGIDLELAPGEVVALVGESGSGKSTIGLALQGLLPPESQPEISGSIRLADRELVGARPAALREARRTLIRSIPQDPMGALNPTMTIGRQLAETGLTPAEVLEWLARVGLPDPPRIAADLPHRLSGGQRQRVLIAMSMAAKPRVLVADEPTTALDVTVEAGIVDLVKDLGKTFGTSMLFISHNLGLILETCDRITVMYSGEAVEEGKVGDVFDRMRHPYTQGLFRSIPLPGADKNSRPLIAIPGQLPLPHERPRGCNFGPRCQHFVEGLCDAREIPMYPVKEHPDHLSRCVRFDDVDWSALPAGIKRNEPVKPGPTVLRIDDLRKYYRVAANEIFGGGEARTVKANESISFEARESETVAIVGESGCGKSTLAKVLLGLETASSGKVLLGNSEIQDTPIEKRDVETISSIQMVFQNPFDTLNPSHSVGSQIVRTLEKFKVGKTQADRQNRMLELLDLVKLPRAFATRMPRQLSGGQKQRIGVARAFAGNARVVVADEPVSALDVSVQAAVTELLMDVQRQNKTTMLFISHDLSVVRYLADRVVVMYLGYIVEQGTTDQIFAPPYHPYTEALLSAIPIADTSVVKKHIVLDGDIPSAMNPPSGCPFQTRCRWKSRVPDNLCETKVPPLKNLGNGHQSLCWLDDAELASMEPVISFAQPDTGAPAAVSAPEGARAIESSGETPVATITADQAPVEPVTPFLEKGTPDPVGRPRSRKPAARSAVPGESSPKRRAAEAGSGRQAVNPKVKPGTTASSGAPSAGKVSRAKARTEVVEPVHPYVEAAPAVALSPADKNRPAGIPRPDQPDDLKLISGIGPKIEATLNGLGIYTYAQIAGWKKTEREWVDGFLRFRGRIDRDDWVKQAKALKKGGVEEYVRLSGKNPR